MNGKELVSRGYSNLGANSSNAYEQSDRSNNPRRKERRKKGVRFENVKVYLFERTQGFDVVPSSGGFALGMQKKHFDTSEVTLRSEITNDGITKSQDEKLSEKSLVEQVCTMPSRHKRKYCNASDKNSAVAKQRRNNCGRSIQTLPKARATANEDRIESRTSERTSSTNIVETIEGKVDNTKREEEDNICLVKKYFHPLSRRIRLLKLKRAGFKKFVNDEAICDDIREKRRHCGCSCGVLPCSPETCECSRNGIECLVDRPSFPCACTTTSCNNPFGRREFDEVVVRAHLCSILMRTQAAQNRQLNGVLSSMHLRFDNG